MSEKWATDCAGYEQEGAADYLKAALQYEKRYETGWSPERMAEAVTEAGFRINKSTIRRRLTALSIARNTRARANSQVFLEAFAEAYAELNAAGRGGGTPLEPEEARRVYLEGVVGEFERLFSKDYTLTDDDLENVRRLRDHCDAVLSGRPVLKLVKTA